MKLGVPSIADCLRRLCHAAVALMCLLAGPLACASVPMSAATSDGLPGHAPLQEREDVAAPALDGHRYRVVSEGPVGGDRVAPQKATLPKGNVDWWIGFHDSTLNLLEQLAHDRQRRPSIGRMSWSGDGERQCTAADLLSGAPHGMNCEDVAASLASAYVHARVLRIRIATAHAIVMNARRQSEKPSKQSTGATGYETDAQQSAAAMAGRAQTAAAEFNATLTRRLTEIAELTGMELAQTRAMLEPSLSASQLPVFGVAVPWRLPGQVLRGRADVQSVEMSLMRDHPDGQVRMKEFATTLDGWVEPNGEMSAKDGEGEAVARAKAEVGAALYRLVRQQQAASMTYQISQLRRTEFEAVLRRQELGEVADGEVLEKHLHLLVENDRLAAAVGAIADAWIALNAATGGLAAVAASGGQTSPQSQSGGTTP